LNESLHMICTWKISSRQTKWRFHC